MPSIRRSVIQWCDLDVQELKSIFIDIIQAHRAYYVSTNQSVFGGELEYARCHQDGEQMEGILVDLDSPYSEDPVLLATVKLRKKTSYADPFPRLTNDSSPTDAEWQYGAELESLIYGLYTLVLIPGHFGSFDDDRLWGEPGPFRRPFSCMVDTWLRPLWRLVFDDLFLWKRRRAHPDSFVRTRLTYENVMDVIQGDVDPSELVFKRALRVPLPPPAPDELAFKPAFQHLTQVATVAEFKRAVWDIAQTISELGDPCPHFPGLTPDRLIFQRPDPLDPDTVPLGFILDLDPLEQPESLTACVGPRLDPRAVRFAAYDIVSTPNPPPPPTPARPSFFLRHVLESLFNSLVWFCAFNTFSESATAKRRGFVPRCYASVGGEWCDPGNRLSHDRTWSYYKAFLRSRRVFLWDRERWFPHGRDDALCEVLDEWVVPLWERIGLAHFEARGRENEDGYDWETFGGQLTVGSFMAILGVKSLS